MLNKKTKTPKRLSNLELFERYVKQSHTIRSVRDCPQEFYKENIKLKQLEDLMRSRLQFGSGEGDNAGNI